MSLFDELRRRNVLRVAIGYLASAWFLIEVSNTILPRLGFSDLAVTNIIVVLAIGFIPALLLAWVFEWTPDGFKRDSGEDSVPVLASRTGRKFDAVIIVVLMLAIGFFAFDKFVLDPGRDSAEIEAATERGRVDAILSSYGEKSIAVLAFRDMSPGHDQEYFSDGIAEEILNVLARIRELRVISRSSAFSFKETASTVPEIAEKLNVSYVLEGSVRKSGNTIRITAQLIDARTDTHIWSETYDRDFDDVFQIQDEISENIVAQLKISILGELAGTQQIDASAYEKYLQANYIVHTEKHDRLREAQALLNEVLAIEPNYIPALNALSRVYYRIPKEEGMTREENIAEIHLIAEHVIALDPDGIAAMIWQGWLAFVDRDYQAAAPFYERGVQLEPNNTSLLRVLVLFLVSIDRAEDAILVGRHLARIDPACGVCLGNLVYAYEQAGYYAEAAHVLESSTVWGEPYEGYFWRLGSLWLQVGDAEKALANFDREFNEHDRVAGRAVALYDLGRMEEFEEQFALVRSDTSHPLNIAKIYAWIGNIDKAFEWIDKAVELMGRRAVRNTQSALFENIQSDPRWRALLDQHGFNDDTAVPVEFNFTPPPGSTTGSW